jgi:hypothetical protein
MEQLGFFTALGLVIVFIAGAAIGRIASVPAGIRAVEAVPETTVPAETVPVPVVRSDDTRTMGTRTMGTRTTTPGDTQTIG